jgi:RNA methyltransferase, TrmH family
MISSIQNDKVKLVRALQSAAKTRRKEGQIVLEGVRLIEDAIRAGYPPAVLFWSSERGLDSVPVDWRTHALEVSPEVMRHMTETETPQGILGIFPLPSAHLPADLARVLILDSIRDPGNLGTILRTGAAAGVQAILLSPTCVDAYNPKVLRSGMGAHFRVPVQQMTWPEIHSVCAGMMVYLATGSGTLDYDQVQWPEQWALIIGSEAHGAGQEAQQLATHQVRIPMAAETESLNAAVAAGILLFVAVRSGSS